jgi:hypothetical protein
VNLKTLMGRTGDYELMLKDKVFQTQVIHTQYVGNGDKLSVFV